MSLSRTLQVKPTTSFYTVKSTHKNSILKHSLTHPFPYTQANSSSTKKKKKKKKKRKKTNDTLNSPNMVPSFPGPLPVQCGGVRGPGNLADATQDCSTSEDFSPRLFPQH